MSTITYDRICIEGVFGIQRILDIQICIEPNQHAVAIIEGVYRNIDELLHWQASDDIQEVTISVKEEQTPIFSGYLRNVECSLAPNYYTAKITIISGSVMLDRQKISASFQDVNATYEEIIMAAIRSTEGASCICTVGRDTKPTKPLIQYAETDWEFAKRLASHFQSVVYSITNRACPGFYFGMPDTGRKHEIDAYEYRHGISNRFYELGGATAGWSAKEFEYYRIKTGDNLDIGTSVDYSGSTWLICEKHAKMQQNELVFTYTLGRKTLVAQNKIYNPVFAGMTILGKVLATGGETVKLHLTIDREQDDVTAYPYVWAPDTSSVMYCMPKVGTTVSLYFSDEDEASARAVNCIRENGSSCAAMSNPENRALTTEHEKQMFLKPDSLGFDIEPKGHAIRLNDDKGIDLSSGKMVRIVAGMELNLKGKTVSLETSQGMSIVRNPEGLDE